ncbi:DNA helicase MCM8 [Paramicrosporidium saccamoebae]|uniref:Minichromosome maintenance 8 n=1 Tax=Paramicrosporidium saccamoebae TaxID=1246581 RepID=A0A2H9TLD2_9FUNG|nr:DNA helicase MCM8 [Paramicrosporidium saccamoebae]
MSKSFVAERESSMTKCINLQKIKIQEMSTLDNADEEGRIPRVIDIELSSDLVDSVVPGEVVTVSGILKAGDPTDKPGPSSLYIDAVSVQKIKSMDATLGVPVKAIDVPEQRLQEIMSVANSKTTLQTLVRSFCPHIYGNELVKMGLLLGLFGGSRRSSQIDAAALSVRSDPHILVVGDPGLGKSQLLTFASLVAPRAVYVCANTSTAVGLTAAVQDGSLEAGALVLADQGCCCIDEFDKIIGDSWRSLLDVMEQQTVNVAKAGIVCTLPARTSILAAANPVGGHYSKEKSVVENLKMDSALLSRFDLIFVLLDKPNADMDKVLSEHVLGSVKSEKGQLRSATVLLTQVTQAPTTLRELLDPKHPIGTIDESLLRHYISYARQKITPRMTEEAAIILQEFYLDMRKKHIPDETLPITTRHLESMIRLSEARAKMELRNFVSAQDAHEVIELVTFCTADTVQTVSTTKIRKGSKTGGMKKFVSELIKISSRTGETEFTTQQLQALFDVLKITELPFGELLDALNENGYLLKKSTGYRLLVT